MFNTTYTKQPEYLFALSSIPLASKQIFFSNRSMYSSIELPEPSSNCSIRPSVVMVPISYKTRLKLSLNFAVSISSMNSAAPIKLISA